MMPKAKITLDTDWFYRVPLKYAVAFLSQLTDNVRCKTGNSIAVLVEKTNECVKNPSILSKKIFGIKEDDSEGLEDDDVLQNPIGIMLTVTALFFVGIVVYVFLRI